MKKLRFILSGKTFIWLVSLFLIGAGVSRYIETDSGNILIHDIDIESLDCYLYQARLFRPIQASSMNQRPAIVLMFGDAGSRYSGDHIAMEFARRGFVILTIEPTPHGISGPVSSETPENPIDSAYTFLTTRFFTDHERVGLITFYAGSEIALKSKRLTDFRSRAMVAPSVSNTLLELPETHILTAKFETDPAFFPNDFGLKTDIHAASHAGMIFHKSVIAALLAQFHEDLSIPNDSPFWFSSYAQRAQVLLVLRFFLLLLLMLICAGLSGLITGTMWKPWLSAPLGILLPVFLFLAATELMNFFIVSVRLGAPFHYQAPLMKVWDHYSPAGMVLFLFFSCISCLPFLKNKKLMVADIISCASIICCFLEFLPVLFSQTFCWSLSTFKPLHWPICLIAFYSCLNSLLLRISSKKFLSRICCAFVNGLMFYFNFCSLTAFQH